MGSPLISRKLPFCFDILGSVLSRLPVPPVRVNFWRHCSAVKCEWRAADKVAGQVHQCFKAEEAGEGGSPDLMVRGTDECNLMGMMGWQY
jgi:hypothetical protein